MSRTTDLFTWGELEAEIDAGFVSLRTHPDDNLLAILNYTKKAQYERHWNNVTRQCRGLIVRLDTDEIVSRPWAKFFNYGEEDVDLDLNATVEVVDKLDGSLGILYLAPDGEYSIATRGSFTSEMAEVGTEIFRKQYAGSFTPSKGYTYLFEIIYPENRIVVDYGSIRDVILLGTVRNSDGALWGPGSDATYRGPRAKTFGVHSLSDALAMAPRDNAEGLVVRVVETGHMVKIKQEDYIALHRIVTGLNERTVWQHMKDNNLMYGDLANTVPEEFQQWVYDTAEKFWRQIYSIEGRVSWEYGNLQDELDFTYGLDGWGRKEFAERAKESEHTFLLFALLDGRDIWPMIHETLRPSGNAVEAKREELMAA